MSKKFEKNEKILLQLINDDPANQQCADCFLKGPRWASYTFGCFLCIRCGGLHRRLGTHISRIKSITLDKWSDDHIKVMKEMGNAKCNAIYCPRPDLNPPPVESDFKMEGYIRDKYELKKFSSSTGSSQNQPYTNILSSTSTGSFNYANEATQLRDMGFTDADAVREALLKYNGNLEAALDYLVSKSARPSEPKPSTQPVLPKDPTEQAIIFSLLDQLHRNGFYNDVLNVQMLAKTNNNLNETLKVLAQQSGSAAKSSEIAGFQNPVAPKPTPVPTQNNGSAMNDLLGLNLFDTPPSANYGQLYNIPQQQIPPLTSFSNQQPMFTSPQPPNLNTTVGGPSNLPQVSPLFPPLQQPVSFPISQPFINYQQAQPFAPVSHNPLPNQPSLQQTYPIQSSSSQAKAPLDDLFNSAFKPTGSSATYAPFNNEPAAIQNVVFNQTPVSTPPTAGSIAPVSINPFLSSTVSVQKPLNMSYGQNSFTAAPAQSSTNAPINWNYRNEPKSTYNESNAQVPVTNPFAKPILDSSSQATSDANQWEAYSGKQVANGPFTKDANTKSSSGVGSPSKQDYFAEFDLLRTSQK